MTDLDDKLWNDDREVRTHHEVPPWIESDIEYNQVAAIVQGGCASGAYMPAVEYMKAARTMTEHPGVLEYLDDYLDHDTSEYALIQRGDTWEGIATRLLSLAVEVWSRNIYDDYHNTNGRPDDQE